MQWGRLLVRHAPHWEQPGWNHRQNPGPFEGRGTPAPAARKLSSCQDGLAGCLVLSFCPADVYEVLAASHYTLLTKEEWDLATSENFNLNLPMEVRSSALHMFRGDGQYSAAAGR